MQKMGGNMSKQPMMACSVLCGYATKGTWDCVILVLQINATLTIKLKKDSGPLSFLTLQICLIKNCLQTSIVKQNVKYNIIEIVMSLFENMDNRKSPTCSKLFFVFIQLFSFHFEHKDLLFRISTTSIANAMASNSNIKVFIGSTICNNVTRIWP